MDRVMRSTNEGVLEGFPKRITLTAAAPTYQMKPGDYCISVVSSADDDAGIVTLPSLAEACGYHYYIEAPTGATGGDISLYEKETGTELTTNGDMDADGDHILLYAAPTQWLTRLDGVV